MVRKRNQVSRYVIDWRHYFELFERGRWQEFATHFHFLKSNTRLSLSEELPTGRPSSTEYIELQSSWVSKPCTIFGHEFFGRSVIMGRSIVPEVGDLTNSPGSFHANRIQDSLHP